MSRRKLELRLSGETTPKRSLGSIECQWQFANDSEIRRMQRLQDTNSNTLRCQGKSLFLLFLLTWARSPISPAAANEEERKRRGDEAEWITRTTLTWSTQSTLTAQRTHNNDTISLEFRSFSDPQPRGASLYSHCKGNKKFRLLCLYK